MLRQLVVALLVIICLTILILNREFKASKCQDNNGMYFRGNCFKKA